MLSGFQLKMLRIKKNVTQTSIAKELGVTRNFISMIENGHRYLDEEQYKDYINALYKYESDTKTPKGRKAKKEIEEIDGIEKDLDNQNKNK